MSRHGQICQGCENMTVAQELPTGTLVNSCPATLTYLTSHVIGRESCGMWAPRKEDENESENDPR